jgi:hypothetical protein
MDPRQSEAMLRRRIHGISTSLSSTEYEKRFYEEADAHLSRTRDSFGSNEEVDRENCEARDAQMKRINELSDAFDAHFA